MQKLRWLLEFRWLFLIALAASLTLVGPPAPAQALGVRSGHGTTVPAGETVRDDLVLAGNSITVDGVIDGDLYAFGETITVNGQINGDLISAGRLVIIRGKVGGNLRAAGQHLTIDGQASRSATVAAQMLSVGRGASIGGNLIAAGESIIHQGSIGKGLWAAGRDLRLLGSVGQEARLAVDRLTLGSASSIGGPLTYHSRNEAVIENGAKYGAIERIIPKHAGEIRREHRYGMPAELIAGIGVFILAKFLGFVLIGLVFQRLFPALWEEVGAEVEARPWRNALIGFLVLVAAPVGMVLSAITLVGLPLSLLAAGLYASIIYLGQMPLSYWLGRKILARTRLSGAHPGWVFALGALITAILTKIPFVGWFLGLVLVCLALGIPTALAERRLSGR